jgi:hypothetical protein
MKRLKNLISRRQFVKLWSGAPAIAIGKKPGAALGGTTDADVIVVGAGSFGYNTAWHLLMILTTREAEILVPVLQAVAGWGHLTRPLDEAFPQLWIDFHWLGRAFPADNIGQGLGPVRV